MSDSVPLPEAHALRTRGLQPLWLMAVLAAASALALYAAFPPLEVWQVAWVGLVPLMLALSQLRPTQGLLAGWLFGAVFMACLNAYMGIYGVMPVLLGALFWGLFYGLFGAAVSALAPLPSPALRVAATAALWALVELGRGHAGPLAYTFGLSGYTQHEMLPILQLASLVGGYGIGFLIALINAGLAALLQAFLPPSWYHPLVPRAHYTRMSGRALLAAWVLLFIVYGWGALVIRSAPGPGEHGVLTAGVAQGNVSVNMHAAPRPGGVVDEIREGIDRYLRLSKSMPGKVDLIVWPETAIGLNLRGDANTQQQLAALARSRDTHLIVGALEVEDGRVYNSAYHYAPDGTLQSVYRKMDLVIFGEYVPMRGKWKWIERYPIRSFDFAAGPGRQVMPLNGVKVGPMVCFEAIFPRPAREITARGAEVLVVLNSDAWANRSVELLYNSRTAPLRAAEARKYLVRAASTGISGIFDPYGRPVATVAANEEGTATATIEARKGLSAYHRWGEFPLLWVCGLFVLVAFIQVRRAAQMEHIGRSSVFANATR
ncbi:MAG TPA: apolipoprotein N-acyltransferase [Armatimonadetes bacterium]|jgi:apolipoprotein N-acyltransferase|nr:apolipoprotein N-acyltransferase [Armatimonadota bacterium]